MKNENEASRSTVVAVLSTNMVRAYKKTATSKDQSLKDKHIVLLERSQMISALLDEAAKKHPMIERSLLESSLAKKTNSGTSIKSIRKVLEAVVNNWIKVNAREFQPGVVKRGAAHSKDGSNVVGDREVGPGARLTSVGKSSGASHRKPFNSALADKLALALVKKE